jgi:hypothetical protein
MNTNNIPIENILKALDEEDKKINEDADKKIMDTNRERSLKLAKNQGAREMLRRFTSGQSESKDINDEHEKKQKPTMNQMREIAKGFIERNAGSANSSEILEECKKMGYDNISKQDIANALSQGGIFVFQRGENNSKKFGKWILKEDKQDVLIVE